MFKSKSYFKRLLITLLLASIIFCSCKTQEAKSEVSENDIERYKASEKLFETAINDGYDNSPKLYFKLAVAKINLKKFNEAKQYLESTQSFGNNYYSNKAKKLLKYYKKHKRFRLEKD